jgi:hypothetical protein
LTNVNVNWQAGEILSLQTLKKQRVPAPVLQLLSIRGFLMNKVVLSISLVLAQLLAVSAIAQTKGEADPAQSKAVPSAKATPEEKAAAKAARKAEGKKVAKEGIVSDRPSTTAKAKAATKEERLAARQKRKAEVAPEVKKGTLPSGEK